MTITIQIGNSDNRLTQEEWSRFVAAVSQLVRTCAREIHFSGGPATDSRWQNFAWVAECSGPTAVAALRDGVAFVRAKFGQDAAAFTVGTTELV